RPDSPVACHNVSQFHRVAIHLRFEPTFVRELRPIDRNGNSDPGRKTSLIDISRAHESDLLARRKLRKFRRIAAHDVPIGVAVWAMRAKAHRRTQIEARSIEKKLDLRA